MGETEKLIKCQKSSEAINSWTFAQILGSFGSLLWLHPQHSTALSGGP